MNNDIAKLLKIQREIDLVNCDKNAICKILEGLSKEEKQSLPAKKQGAKELLEEYEKLTNQLSEE